MKQSDIATIVLIAAISVTAAYFIANAVVGKPSSTSVSVKTAEPISAEVQEPDKNIFNKDAINPTVEVTIGDK